jgi:hypothetical protein
MDKCRLLHEEYTIGWVCVLPIELDAAAEMLDEEHHDLVQDADDTDLYGTSIQAGMSNRAGASHFVPARLLMPECELIPAYMLIPRRHARKVPLNSRHFRCSSTPHLLRAAQESTLGTT